MTLLFIHTPNMEHSPVTSSLTVLGNGRPISSKLTLGWASLPGSGPKGRHNEDGLLVAGHQDSLLLLVVDGVSPLAKAEIPNGGYLASKHAISSICRAYVGGERDPVTLLLCGNNAVREISAELGIDRNDYAQLIACTATLVILDFASYTMRYAHLGDSALVIKYRGKEWARITSDKVSRFDNRALNMALEINPENPAEILQDPASEPWRILQSNRQYQNAAGGEGYGVLNGCEEAMVLPYIETSKQPATLEEIEWFVLLTDGAIIPTHLNDENQQWELLGTPCFPHDIGSYLDNIREAEVKDPLLKEYPRVKMHDDATVVAVKNESVIGVL